MVESPRPVRSFNPRLPSGLQRLEDDRLSNVGINVYVKRDDLINPEIPGNKWRKLKYNLSEANKRSQRTILTFGGAYSNHIRAVAAAGHYFGFSTIGVIRGEQHLPLNPSLRYAVNHGMRLVYLDRHTYRHKNDPGVIGDLAKRLGDFYLIPEGGSNQFAVKGCAELPAELTIDYDVICCPCGTGGTLAGIAAGLPPGRKALGFSVLKGGQFLNDDVRSLQQRSGVSTDNWSIETSYYFGGYAKRTTELDNFSADFWERHHIELDWIYVAKMMYGIFDLAVHRYFPPETTIVAVLTG